MSGIEFTFNNLKYEIEFERVSRNVRVGFNDEGQPIYRPSKYPTTVVTLWQISPSKMNNFRTHNGDYKFRDASAACYHKDKFTLEKGRLAALKMVGKTLSKEMRKIMWTAYLNRPRLTGKPKVETFIIDEGIDHAVVIGDAVLPND